MWAGNDANDAPKAKGITGGTIAAAIWSGYMNGFYRSHPKPTVAFVNPEQPLTHSGTYITYSPGTESDLGDEVLDSIESVTEPIVRGIAEPLLGSNVESSRGHDAEQSAPDEADKKHRKKGKSFFRKISEGIRKIF